MSLYTELCEAGKLKLQEGEEFSVFAKRAVDHINRLSDKDWGQLTKPLQLWLNAAMKALDQGNEAPKLAGFPVEEEAESDDAESGEEAEAGSEEASESEEEAESDNEEAEIDESEADDEEPAPEEAEEAEEEASAPAPRKKAVKKTASKAVGKKPAPKKPAPKATPKVAAKKPTVAAKKASGRPNIFGDAATIKVLAKANPYRDGSLGAKVFAKYKDGMKVSAFVAAAKALKLTRPPVAMLRFDAAKGHVKVVSPSN